MTGTVGRTVETSLLAGAVVGELAGNPETIDGELAERTARLLGVLANGRRLDLIRRLGDRELDVGQLAELSELSQSNVSQHLGRLRSAGIVVSDRRGQHVTNRLSTPLITALCEMGCRLAEELDPSHPNHRPDSTKESQER